MTIEHNDNLDFTNLRVNSESIEYWKNRFNKREGLFASTLTSRALYDYYKDDSDQFFQTYINGTSRAFPILSRPEWTSELLNPQDVISNVSGDEWDVAYDKGFLQRMGLQRAALTINKDRAPIEVNVRDFLWNNPMYQITSINTLDSGFNLDVGMTDFYTYVTHATKVGEELYDVFARENISHNSPDAVTQDALSSLRVRNTYAPDFDHLERFHRAHALNAIVTLIVRMPNGTHYVTNLSRSSTPVDYPSTRSVAPAGVFSPWFNPELECDLTYFVLREFGEEIFSRDTLRQGPERKGSIQWVRECIPAKWLGDLLEDPNGGARLFVSGLGIDALNGSTKLAMLLYVDDPMFSSWIYDYVENVSKPMKEGRVSMLSVKKTAESLLTDNWSPAAAFSLSQGIRLAQDKLDADFDVNLQPPKNP